MTQHVLVPSGSVQCSVPPRWICDRMTSKIWTLLIGRAAKPEATQEFVESSASSKSRTGTILDRKDRCSIGSNVREEQRQQWQTNVPFASKISGMISAHPPPVVIVFIVNVIVFLWNTTKTEISVKLWTPNLHVLSASKVSKRLSRFIWPLLLMIAIHPPSKRFSDWIDRQWLLYRRILVFRKDSMNFNHCLMTKATNCVVSYLDMTN